MPTISINVKASNDQKYVISIEPTETIRAFKEKIAESCDTPADRIRLIYSGRVLKDEDKVETYNIVDGHTVHMVRGAATSGSSAPTAAAPAATTPSTTTPANTAATNTTTPAATTTTPAAAAGNVRFNLKYQDRIDDRIVRLTVAFLCD
jgi:ubiquilin